MNKEQKSMPEIKGYKVFNPEWTCMGFQYKVGETYEMSDKPVICKRGFHFCKNLIDCFNYYDFDPNNKIAEIIAMGDIDEEEDKSCTNKIHILKEITWNETLELVNTGEGCTGLGNSGNHNSGYHNSGDHNSGDCNSGDCNSGNHNSGDHNSGDRNSGDYNSGDHNSGYYNSGRHNSGRHNSGHYNSGDYNSGRYNSGSYNSGSFNLTSYSSGWFCTKEPKLIFFNKETEITASGWINSEAYSLFLRIHRDACKWIPARDMTDEEKSDNPKWETTGGYLKKCDEDFETCCKKWWESLTLSKKEIIKTQTPNFDPDIFREITGIEV